MFARVIPALRTPFGVDAFDYAVPNGLALEVGDVVTFPFRGRPLVGVVGELNADSPYAAKAKPLIGRYADLRLPRSFVDLVRWTAARTFSSQATVVHAWLRDLPRRPHPPSVTARSSQPLRHPERNSSEVEGSGPREPDSSTRRQASSVGMTDVREIAALRQTPLAMTVDPEAKLIETARTQTGRTLIITPWKERASRYALELNAPLLTSDTPSAAAFHTWSDFLAKDEAILVTTRVGAWLACGADAVLLDEPENDDHKQDELAPRYDARRLTAWCAEHAGVTVESFGRTPPITEGSDAPTIECELTVRERQRAGRSDIPTVLADTLADLVTHEGPRIIYHPIRGIAARLRCRDCSWSAACERCTFPLSVGTTDAECRRCGSHAPLPETCPHCGSASLGASTPGIDRLQTVWRSKFPDQAVEWRNLSNADVEKPLPENALVVVTDGALLAGATEDVLRLERTAIAFRRLADRVHQANGRLIIQSDAVLLAWWEKWLTAEGFASFCAEELTSRRLFGYPPMKHLVKILVDGSEEEAQAWGERAKASLDATWELRGPWPVAYRSKGRSTRFVWHAVTGPDAPDADLIKLFTPLAGQGVLIDLDPIAFFR